MKFAAWISKIVRGDTYSRSTVPAGITEMPCGCKRGPVIDLSSDSREGELEFFLSRWQVRRRDQSFFCRQCGKQVWPLPEGSTAS